jgi:hypothetical protein
MLFDPVALTAIIVVILMLPFMLFILAHTARRAGQDAWDHAEQARHQHLPKRFYTQRYIDALDAEPRPRGPHVPILRSKRARKLRPSAPRKVAAVHRSAVIRAVIDDDDATTQWRIRLAPKHVHMLLPPKVYDRYGRPRSAGRVQVYSCRKNTWRLSKIEEI